MLLAYYEWIGKWRIDGLLISSRQSVRLNQNNDLVSSTQHLRMSLQNPAQSLPAICTRKLNRDRAGQAAVKAPRKRYPDRLSTGTPPPPIIYQFHYAQSMQAPHRTTK